MGATGSSSVRRVGHTLIGPSSKRQAICICMWHNENQPAVLPDCRPHPPNIQTVPSSNKALWWSRAEGKAPETWLPLICVHFGAAALSSNAKRSSKMSVRFHPPSVSPDQNKHMHEKMISNLLHPLADRSHREQTRNHRKRTRRELFFGMVLRDIAVPSTFRSSS